MMSLFGARTKSTFQKAKERLDKRMEAEARKSKGSTPGASIMTEESSHIGGLLDKITGPLTVTDLDGVAATSEIARTLSA